MTNSPKGTTGGGGDREEMCSGGVATLISGVGEREFQAVESAGTSSKGRDMMLASSTCGLFGADRCMMAQRQQAGEPRVSGDHH
jgi:hypothetical protein